MDSPRVDEPPTLPAITDAHVHLWDLRALRYPWLTDQYDAAIPAGPYREICRNFLIPDLLRNAGSLPLAKIVHIAAAIGHPDPIDETAFIEAHAAEHGMPLAIIASVDLSSADVAAQLERHSVHASFRGMRALSVGRDLWGGSALMSNLKHLEAADVVYELDVQFPHYASAARAVRRHASLRMVIDHAGMPTARSADHFRAWREGMSELAAAPNVACKISGLGVHDHHWTIDSLRPWVETIIELFGPQRTMLASDWPVGSLYSSYPALYAAYSRITASLRHEERRQVFGTTAEAWYRI
jgi:predicted TIM-barrel fold metal-dependent hydrolase